MGGAERIGSSRLISNCNILVIGPGARRLLAAVVEAVTEVLVDLLRGFRKLIKALP